MDDDRAERLDGLLMTLGWSKAHFARQCGVHAYTVTRWRPGGKQQPPVWAVRYAEVLVSVRALARAAGVAEV